MAKSQHMSFRYSAVECISAALEESNLISSQILCIVNLV